MGRTQNNEIIRRDGNVGKWRKKKMKSNGHCAEVPLKLRWIFIHDVCIGRCCQLSALMYQLRAKPTLNLIKYYLISSK